MAKNNNISSDLKHVGDNFIVGFSSEKLNSEEKSLLKTLKPLGIILFAKNIYRGENWISKLKDLIRETKDLVENESLIVSVDHEGGRVHRFIEPVTKFPAAKKWKQLTKDVARAMAWELSALGFNLNFAPVADVHSEEKNPVIGERAFAEKAEEVAELAVEFFKEQEKNFVLACAKHFPGHGATISDSHLELPRLDLSEDKLYERELIPFKKLIVEGISLIMTAHVIYPQLDADNPATLSPKIINDLLRTALNYQAVVITDDLEMKALRQFTPEQKAIKAVDAGVDILLEANPQDQLALKVAARMAIGLLNSMEKKVEFENKLLQSQKRINFLKDKIRKFKSPVNLDCLGSKEHQDLVRQLIV